MRRLDPRHWSLMTKLPLTIIVMVFGSAMIMGLMVIDRDATRQSARLGAQTFALARAIAAAGENAVLSRDIWQLYRTLDQLVNRASPDSGEVPVIDAMFLTPDGVVLAHTDPAAHPVGMPMATGSDFSQQLILHVLATQTPELVPASVRSEGSVDAVVPIRVDETVVGFLVLRSTTAPMLAQLRKDATLVEIFSVSLALVMSTFGALISRRMVSPLHKLADGLDAVSRGDHDAVADVRTGDRDEIGQLTEQFNRMVRELARNKRLEQDLARAERLAGLGRFAAGLAHEVNNPLGGMKNCVNMLARRPDDADLVRKYLPLLDSGLNRISATIQALLGELRGENNAHPCKMNCLVDLEALVRAEIGDRPIGLDWQAGKLDLAGKSLSCTCPHVHQIVMNLTRNAIAVMPDGGSLKVAARREGATLTLDIVDTGPGLDAAAQARLFEPFYTTSPNGTGLGLWITYALVNRMNGSIGVESAPGQGTRFTVALPLLEPFALPRKEANRAA